MRFRSREGKADLIPDLLELDWDQERFASGNLPFSREVVSDDAIFNKLDT